ncbi:glycosyltransferase family 2 protein [Enterobacteriaceae bacterium H20N1]|uniref:Glycosyltransferase family 2 protein n=1 Tax=Dryocola boscaweniae TaxID=2925397 RepID=A0A9X2W8E9_9ENTR|nr:glycosyltransferase family 2 protein [Dryocola boscaweniae]MCT4702587.1 glycosyltransferase family 2 protein [Dryocola boscaweniae]MCT4719755.1 glycosyltransferase family 2 protein [Dryocola boscaweniae]
MGMGNFISVISHGHAALIKELNVLSKLAISNTVIIKCNKESDVVALEGYCKKNNIHLITDNYGLGFGANNNLVFNYCRKNLGLKAEDYFIVMNPDLEIDTYELKKLNCYVLENASKLSTINLYKNEEKTVSDDAIRKYPKMGDFFLSLVLKKNRSKYNKTLIEKPTEVDWAAGSFLMFQADHYQQLGGFDEKYFMYCEDIDICYRSSLLKHKPIYYPDVTAVHYAKHANRSFLSKHFFWHLKSALLFLAMRYKNPIKIN